MTSDCPGIKSAKLLGLAHWIPRILKSGFRILFFLSSSLTTPKPLYTIKNVQLLAAPRIAMFYPCMTISPAWKLLHNLWLNDNFCSFIFQLLVPFPGRFPWFLKAKGSTPQASQHGHPLTTQCSSFLFTPCLLNQKKVNFPAVCWLHFSKAFDKFYPSPGECFLYCQVNTV